MSELRCALFLSLLAGAGHAGEEFPPFDKISDGYEKVVSTADGSSSLYTLYVNEKDAQVLAELPGSFENQKIFIHNVVSSGSPLAGVGLLMSGERYGYWKRIGKKLALMEPELAVRATGDKEDKLSQEMMYTPRVITSVPILAMGPGGGPVIDLDALFVQGAATFFGPIAAGADVSLSRVTKSKAFPKNIEVAFEMPLGQRSSGTPLFGLDMAPPAGGRMTELHYSIRLVPQNNGYKPREADPRAGFFTTSFNDMSKTTEGPNTWVRYITRWHLEKADPKLKLSPAKEPIVWYIEHTTPIRFRRYIREAILAWNDAFEGIGLLDAVEVRQQDAGTGAYMDIDPEDMRYNFVRWNNNQASFAIGPSRWNPETGQIFDADVTINAGIFASFSQGFRSLLPALAIEGFTAETMAWLDEHPEWDPRARLTSPATRTRFLAEQAERAREGTLGTYPEGYSAGLASELQESWRRAGLPLDAPMAHCLAGAYAALSTDLVRMVAEAEDAEAAGEDDGEASEEDEELLIEGLPESYVAQLFRWLTLHEVGHCLGLRHNFAASTIHPLAHINSPEFPADEATGGSVMEYTPANINHGLGETQGQWLIQYPGPYDQWVIDFGYGFGDPQKVLERSSEPHHVYGDNLDGVGPDPRVRTYDFGEDPVEFCRSRMGIVAELRPKIVSELVEDGEHWGAARRMFQGLVIQQVTAISIAAGWVGGSFVNKDVKGQPNGRAPIEDIPVERQRAALEFVIEHSFPDEAYGLTEEILRHTTVDRWGDMGDADTWDADPALPVHDLVSGVQSAALTMILNPTTLRRVFDNELRVPADQDALTVSELLDRVCEAAFGQLESIDKSKASRRSPALSSLQRHLQAEIVERLISLAMDEGGATAATRTMASLARAKLVELRTEVITFAGTDTLDPYTKAHTQDLISRISKALDAHVIYGR